MAELKPCKCGNNKPEYFVRSVKYSSNPEHIYVCKKMWAFWVWIYRGRSS